MSQLPLYQQIKRYIINQIDSGIWSVGQRISTELELTEQFNVSRMTVNKAIRDLVSDGRLQRTPKLGTFVCQVQDKAESPLVDIRNIAIEVTERGQSYSNKVIAQSQISADEATATKLGVMRGSLVFFSEIIHYADELPIQLELRWVNPEFATDYLKQDFTEQTPTQYLFDACPLSAIEHSVEAVTIDSKKRKLLKISESEPCLLLNRRTWSGNNLVSSALLYHPGSRYKLSSTINLIPR
ncbi:histidine utilization repressor [Vibrio sp. 404]|uniref:Histidine utilization repressor n=1 Tax=Vibrio marinisediminis TaxID=2758441 RepID=A0A7W2FRL2_9VIBR|nr:histidine utilization repressor [Vibrio marinisediminis]MBA5763001.1 histidine utilization repressor [Vibrio marinisediminis]